MGNQFGALKGVFIPSILTILGVILFLRTGWVVGQVGFGVTVFIILLSSTITFITGLSISATATNTKVGAGGSYFLISRCFGLEPGAAVGFPLYLAQALGISFYSVGFAESLQLFLPNVPVKFVAITTLIALTLLTLYSSDVALKTQTIILVLITLAITSFWFGHSLKPEVIPPSEFTKVGFWEVFAVFFPAVTGIEAGISMSGDLKDPRKALPIGTISAVLVGAVVYIISAYLLDHFASPAQLMENNLILTEIAAFPVLIFLGLWGAALSSTMGALMGAPRTLQALARDRVLPKFLAKGSGPANEPKIATLFSAFVASLGILLGDLNAIASVLSMFFLTSYGALNLNAGLEGLIDNPTWRPAFKVSWLISIIGAFLCFGAMFMIDSGSSFIALGIIALIYFIMRKRGIKSNYSDIRSGLILFFSKVFVFKLNKVGKSIRNWRPNFLIFTGSPQSRLHLVELARSISHDRGFMTSATLIIDNDVSMDKLDSLQSAAQDFFIKSRIDAFAKFLKTDSFFNGLKTLVDSYGVGEIVPNTVILGDSSKTDINKDYIESIVYSHKNKRNVIIVKDSEDSDATVMNGGRVIDVWWNQRYNESRDFILTLANMLRSSSRWLSAEMNVHVLVETEESRKNTLQHLKEFFKSSRIKANPNVHVCPRGEEEDTVARFSKNSDIVFLNLPSPEKVDDFEKVYQQYIQFSKRLRTTLLVMQGEELDFDRVFD